jgi:hypothetical protein
MTIRCDEFRSSPGRKTPTYRKAKEKPTPTIPIDATSSVAGEIAVCRLAARPRNPKQRLAIPLKMK